MFCLFSSTVAPFRARGALRDPDMGKRLLDLFWFTIYYRGRVGNFVVGIPLLWFNPLFVNLFPFFLKGLV